MPPTRALLPLVVVVVVASWPRRR